MAKSYYNWYDSNEFTFRSVTFYVNLFQFLSLSFFQSKASLTPSWRVTRFYTYIELHKLSSTKKWTLSPCLLSVLRWSHPLLSPFFLSNSFLSVTIICSRMNCRNPMMISHTFNHYRSPKLRFWRCQVLTIGDIIIWVKLMTIKSFRIWSTHE